jgi:hypothetical protein
MNNNFMFNDYAGNVYNKYVNAVQQRATDKKMAAAGITTPTFNQGHNIHLALFEDTIYDYLNRDLSIYNLIPSYEATGQPTLWFEQTKRPSNEQFSDPNTLTYKTLDEDYGRVPKSAMIKCITSKFHVPFFNTLVARQQNALPDFVQKDIEDWAYGIKRYINNKLYYGTDTDLATPTTNEYMGIMSQITNKVTKAKSDTTNITDLVETEIATMDSDIVHNTGSGSDLVIMMNGLTMDRWVKQERAINSNFRPETAEIIPGFSIPAIRTAKGLIPVVTDNFINITDNTANGSKDHPIVVLNRRMVERRYIGSANPMVFDWNIGNDQLTTDKLAVLFDNVIVRGGDFAHILINYQIATA